MKKSFLTVALMALVGVSALHAIDVSSGIPPFMSVYGAATRGDSTVQLGTNPRDKSTISIPATAAVNISQGEVVVPRGDTKLQEGDEVLAITDSNGVAQLATLFARPSATPPAA